MIQCTAYSFEKTNIYNVCDCMSVCYVFNVYDIMIQITLCKSLRTDYYLNIIYKRRDK